MVQMTGKFVRTKEEGYENFLKELGTNMLLRKAATASTPTMDISVDGTKWKIVTATTLKKMELEFELGVPFDEVTTDGRKCKTTVSQEGDDTLVTQQVAQKEGEKSVTVTRVFSDEGIDVTYQTGDVVSKQFFKRQ